jgi:hypothetical protein
MRYKPLLLVFSLTVGSSALAEAQIPGWVNDILTAAQLPIVTAEARREGISNADIGAILGTMRQTSIPAAEAKVILDSARAAHRDNGPVDNFGAFVQSQLASGKRGTALAAAIRAEHARVGRGRAGAGNRGGGNARGASGRQGNDANAARGRSGQKPADTVGRGAGNRGRGRPPLTQS